MPGARPERRSRRLYSRDLHEIGDDLLQARMLAAWIALIRYFVELSLLEFENAEVGLRSADVARENHKALP